MNGLFQFFHDQFQKQIEASKILENPKLHNGNFFVYPNLISPNGTFLKKFEYFNQSIAGVETLNDDIFYVTNWTSAVCCEMKKKHRFVFTL